MNKTIKVYFAVRRAAESAHVATPVWYITERCSRRHASQLQRRQVEKTVVKVGGDTGRCRGDPSDGECRTTNQRNDPAARFCATDGVGFSSRCRLEDD